MVRKTIEQTIIKHNLIHRGEHIVIGLSGGPDSVCLFHVLKNLSEEMDFALYAVHVNHKFRPVDAEEDQAYVEALCESEGIACIPFVYDCNAMARERKITGEEAGRKARYEAFGKTAAALIQNGVSREKIKIAVAQNADDQAETVLLRLLRGAGTDGLSGMNYVRGENGIPVVRPLLDVRRTEIEAYCREHGLEPRIDRTNLQPLYTRNKVRLELIPHLRKSYNSNIVSALIRLSKIAAEDKEYLWKITEQTYKTIMIRPEYLDLEKLRRLEPAIRHRVMIRAFRDAGLTQDIAECHLEAADRLLERAETSKMLDFPGGFAVTIGYGEVRFHRKRAAAVQRESQGLSIRITEPQEQYPAGAAIFDWDKLCGAHENATVRLRNRRPGDYIGLKNGRKKLQDFFVDQKVPAEARNRIPVAAVGSEILWVIAADPKILKAHRYNEHYKLDPKTKRVLTLEFDCEI